jgi:UPF0148 protein
LDEEEKLGRITRLLEQGCTMLATHHSCGAPLFRCKGEVVCPVCSFGPVSEESAKGPALIIPSEEKGPVEGRGELSSGDVGSGAGPGPSGQESVSEGPKGDYMQEAEVLLAASLLNKIRDLAAKIESEQDLERLQKELDCAVSLLQVLESLKRPEA